MAFKIGNILIENKVILAPMAGVSNSPFRKKARINGAGLVFAEMISDKGLINDNAKTKSLLYMEDSERPMAQQIFGSDINSMVEAAKLLEKLSNCDIIDINMGCPVPKVAIRAQAGSALMKDPIKVYELVKAVVDAVNRPVTVKIRSGWDKQSINAVEVAKQIEKAGAKAITIHAKTRSQGYSGKADLDIIKLVKAAISIPVIGNGNINSGKKAQEMLDYTNCDAVMIGREALGNPWIFKEIDAYLNNKPIPSKPNNKEVYDLIISHMEDLIALKGERIGLLEMQRHTSGYLKGYKNSVEAKKKLKLANTIEEVKEILKNFFVK